MPNPTGTFQRPDLGTAFSQLPDDSDGFVATECLPVYNSPLQSANYSVIKAEALMRLEDLKRGPNAGYKRSAYDFSQANFSTSEFGLEEPIDDRTRKLYSYSFDVERFAAARLRRRLRTNLEVLTATAVQGSLGGTAAAAKKWNDPASDPVYDVDTALVAYRALNALNPEDVSMVMDWETFLRLRSNAAILDRIKFSGLDQVVKAKITKDAIAQVFGIKEVIVARAMKNTADVGQTRSLSPIWDKTIVTLFHKATGDIQMPGLGHTIVWTADGASADGVMEEYREEQTRSQILRCRSELVSHIKYTNAGYTITAVL